MTLLIRLDPASSCDFPISPRDFRDSLQRAPNRCRRGSATRSRPARGRRSRSFPCSAQPPPRRRAAPAASRLPVHFRSQLVGPRVAALNRYIPLLYVRSRHRPPRRALLPPPALFRPPRALASASALPPAARSRLPQRSFPPRHLLPPTACSRSPPLSLAAARCAGDLVARATPSSTPSLHC